MSTTLSPASAVAALATGAAAGVAGAVQAMRDQLAACGYATTTDVELGLPADLREHLVASYFTPDVLRNDIPDIPADRERARDVIRYAWTDDALTLAENDSITLGARGNLPGRREYSRVRLLDDPAAAVLIERALSLVPAAERRPRGTFGVNLFRTHTNVVTGPHQDGEEFILIYVLDKCGSGAETTLYSQADESIVFKDVLEPGELIIFRDRDFLHTASPITPPASSREGARRDVLVCTVDYPSTYGFAEGLEEN